MNEFFMSVLPWVVIAIFIACLVVSHKETTKGKDSAPEDAKDAGDAEEAEANQMAMGLCVGTCVGTSLGAAGVADSGIGISLGMSIGMADGDDDQEMS